jgi:hypothetical protein
MNLSTSSSKGHWRAIILALALLLAVEGVVRWLEPSLSTDVRHIEHIPQTLRELAGNPGDHVLFLGNSLTREGVDMQVLRPVLARQQVNLQNLNFGFVYPDSADILDWLYVYRHNVSEATRPDVLIVSFADDALADEDFPDPESIRRLARHHTAPADIPYVFSEDLTRLSQRGDFLISKLFVSFAHRERVRTRFLYSVLPNYQATQRAINQANAPTPTQGTALPDYHYSRLERFLELVDTQKVDVIFVAMPTLTPYLLDPALPGLVTNAGAQFIDLSTVLQLSSGDFKDYLHLNQAGAKIYSRIFGRELAPYLLERGGNSTPG